MAVKIEDLIVPRIVQEQFGRRIDPSELRVRIAMKQGYAPDGVQHGSGMWGDTEAKGANGRVYKSVSKELCLKALTACMADLSVTPSISGYTAWREGNPSWPAAITIRKKIGGWPSSHWNAKGLACL